MNRKTCIKNLLFVNMLALPILSYASDSDRECIKRTKGVSTVAGTVGGAMATAVAACAGGAVISFVVPILEPLQAVLSEPRVAGAAIYGGLGGASVGRSGGEAIGEMVCEE